MKKVKRKQGGVGRLGEDNPNSDFQISIEFTHVGNGKSCPSLGE
jgi:hypothetical protein